jgi:hypothetical protein
MRLCTCKLVEYKLKENSGDKSLFSALPGTPQTLARTRPCIRTLHFGLGLGLGLFFVGQSQNAWPNQTSLGVRSERCSGLNHICGQLMSTLANNRAGE